jgi:hypothetical protein
MISDRQNGATQSRLSSGTQASMVPSDKQSPPLRDHIGLYPAKRPSSRTKTGGGHGEDIVPLVYVLTIGEGVG